MRRSLLLSAVSALGVGCLIAGVALPPSQAQTGKTGQPAGSSGPPQEHVAEPANPNDGTFTAVLRFELAGPATIAGLRAELQELESRSRQLARSLRGDANTTAAIVRGSIDLGQRVLDDPDKRVAPDTAKPSPAQVEEMRGALRKTVEAAFHVRQRLQLLELQEMARRLQALEKQLAARDALRQQIIERRVNDLLNPALPNGDELNWNSEPTKPTPPPAATAAPSQGSTHASPTHPAAAGESPRSALVLRAPDEYRRALFVASGVVRDWEVMLDALKKNDNPKELQTGHLAQVMSEFALRKRELESLRNEYAGQLLLWELEVKAAALVARTAEEKHKQLVELARNRVVGENAVSEAQRERELAQVRLEQTKAVLELYRKGEEEVRQAIPEGRPAGDVKEVPDLPPLGTQRVMESMSAFVDSVDVELRLMSVSSVKQNFVTKGIAFDKTGNTLVVETERLAPTKLTNVHIAEDATIKDGGKEIPLAALKPGTAVNLHVVTKDRGIEIVRIDKVDEPRRPAEQKLPGTP